MNFPAEEEPRTSDNAAHTGNDARTGLERAGLPKPLAQGADAHSAGSRFVQSIVPSWRIRWFTLTHIHTRKSFGRSPMTPDQAHMLNDELRKSQSQSLWLPVEE